VQIPVRLGDGKIFGVALGGVEPGVTLDSLRRDVGAGGKLTPLRRLKTHP
jgi:hypothetical protein